MPRYEKICTVNEILKGKEGVLIEAQRQEIHEWSNKLDKLDRETNNNNRRHSEWRDGIDVTIADREARNGEYISAADLLKLGVSEEFWLDMIFSQNFEDLPELICNEEISNALKTLTDRQKEVLYLTKVMGYDTRNIVNMMGTSNRNITDHRKKAILKIKKELGLPNCQWINKKL